MRQHSYANTSAQQQPARRIDRQQQQSSGAADYHLLPVIPLPAQVNAGFAPERRRLKLVSARGAAQAS